MAVLSGRLIWHGERALQGRFRGLRASADGRRRRGRSEDGTRTCAEDRSGSGELWRGRWLRVAVEITLDGMEHRDYFTFRNSGIRLWLGGVSVLAGILVVALPPSFWLCVTGGALLALGILSHSARTGQWFTWQNWEPSLNWFEGWAACTGVLLIVVPLLVLVALSWWPA